MKHRSIHLNIRWLYEIRLKIPTLYSIEKITIKIAEIDLETVAKQFGEVDLDNIRRPDEVDLLIGYNYAGWHPTTGKVNEHLVILVTFLVNELGDDAHQW